MSKGNGNYSDNEILELASEIIFKRKLRGQQVKGPLDIKNYLDAKMAKHDREVFGVILLSHEYRVIAYEELFFGTIDKATVHARPIVDCAIKHKASTIALVHSHPFRSATPSDKDIAMTRELKNILAPLDIYIMDHYIVGDDFYSMRFQGFKELFK